MILRIFKLKFNDIVMNKIWIKSLVILILSSLSFSAFSQNPISLGDAIQLALANNYNIIIAGKNVEIAKNNYNRGEAGYYPAISFNVNNTNSLTDQNDPSSFVQGFFISNRVTPNVDVKWVLFDGLRIRANYEQLRKLSELSEGNEIVILQSTVQGVILAYNNVLLQEEKLKTNRVVLKLSGDRFAYFQNRKELGTAVTFDLLQAKNAMLNDSTIVISQRLELQRSVRQLNRLMVVDLEETWQFTDSLVAIPAPYNYETLKSSMLASNANLRVQFVNQELKSVALKQSKSGRYPSIIFNPGANYTFSHFDGTLPSGDAVRTDGTTTNFYANLALNFNLYNGGKTRRAIRNARISVEIAELSTDDLEATLLQELGDQFNRWQAMIEILMIANENLVSAELNMDIATEKYRNGNINSFNFRDVQKTYAVVALTKLQAEFNVIAAQTDLLRLSGGILSITGE
jgi:outer membrane protein TolC